MRKLSPNYLKQRLLTGWSLLTIGLGFALVGWLMNGLNASTIAYIGTLAVSCYLIWVGSEGVALASVWVVGLMSIAAIKQHWFHDMPRPEYRYIPMTLLVNWLIALAIVWQLGKISDTLQETAFSRVLVISGLISLVAASFCLGWQVYPETLLLATLK